MKITIEVLYKKGDIVYLRTDTDKSPRMVLKWEFDSDSNSVIYYLAQETMVSQHYDFEITENKYEVI
jgi:hypothetical protein